MHHTNKSLTRAVSLLDSLAAGPQTLTQISDQIGITTSGTLKVLRTFIEAQIVCQLADGRYALACGTCRFARAYLTQNPLSQLALPLVQQLSAGTGTHVVLGILQNNQQVNILYIDHVLGFADTLPAGVGAAWPQATGQMLLAHAAAEEVAAHLKKYPLVKGRTTSGTVRELRANLEQIRTQGYAIVEAPYMGTIAAAAPVRDFTGQVVAALGHPLSHNKGHAARIATIRRTADKISALLGHEPSQ